MVTIAVSPSTATTANITFPPQDVAYKTKYSIHLNFVLRIAYDK